MLKGGTAGLFGGAVSERQSSCKNSSTISPQNTEDTLCRWCRERTREGNDSIMKWMTQVSSIKNSHGLRSDERSSWPSCSSPLTGLAMAEHFRDEEKRDALLSSSTTSSDLHKLVPEISALLGRIPSGRLPTNTRDRNGYTPRTYRLDKKKMVLLLQYRQSTSLRDDLTDPAPANTFAHLDSTVVLNRSIAELGIYPAVDPSRLLLLSSRLVSSVKSTILLLVKYRKPSRDTKSSKISSPSSGMDELGEDDKIAVARARKIQRFFSQPFFVAEHHRYSRRLCQTKRQSKRIQNDCRWWALIMFQKILPL